MLGNVESEIGRIFRRGRAEVRRLLDGLHDFARSESEDEFRHRQQSRYEQILSCTGETLFEAVGRIVTDEEWEFYYWPGYNSVFPASTVARRVTLSTNGIACGIGVLRDGAEQTRYSLDRSALWYSRVLTRHEGDGDFYPGSTHRWLIEAQPQIAKERLRFLIVHNTTNDENAQSPGWTSVRLDSSSPHDYGRQMAEQLNDSGRIQQLRPWPYSAATDRFDHLRLELYNLWLAAVFESEWPAKADNWFAQVADRCKDAGEIGLSTRILEPETEPIQRTRYRYWYSIGFRPVGSDELGSAMFLSSHRLPEMFVEEANDFIFNLYSGWRLFEDNLSRDRPWIKKKTLRLLTATDWNDVRQQLWDFCGTAKPGRNFCHHLPGGGEPYPSSHPYYALIPELTRSLRQTLTATGVETTFLPDHFWNTDASSAEPWLGMPIRAMASFDHDAHDLTHVIAILATYSNNLIAAGVTCRVVINGLDRDGHLLHDFLWFNAIALCDGLYQIACAFRGQVKKAQERNDSCAGGSVQWTFLEEAIDDETLRFAVRIEQHLVERIADSEGLISYQYRLPDPSLSAAQTGKEHAVHNAYARIREIGFEIGYRHNVIEFSATAMNVDGLWILGGAPACL